MRKYGSLLLVLILGIALSSIAIVYGQGETGFIWLDSPDEVYLGSTINSWVENQDLSDDGVPSTATGVILGWVADTGSSSYSACARGAEDTTDYMSPGLYCEIEGETWRMQIVKLGSNKYIDTRRENTAIRLFVFGYTVGEDPSYRTVPEQISIAVTGWQTYTAPNVDADTDGVILFIQSGYGQDMCVQVRATGSSNDQTSREWEDYQCSVFMVKIDENDQFQIYLSVESARIYLVGETQGNSAQYWTDYIQITDPSYGSWQDIDLDTYVTVPDGATGAFFWAVDSVGDDMLGLVKNGGTFPTTSKDIGGDQQIILGTGIDSEHVFDTYYEDSTVTLYFELFTLYSEGVGGQEYYRYPSQAFSLSSSAIKLCTLTRLGSQSLSITSSTEREWSLTRVFNQEITFTCSALGEIIKVFNRFSSMALSISSNAYREWSLTRVQSQSLTLSSESMRTASLTKIAEQLLTLSTESYRSWTLTRSLSQGLSFISNSFKSFDAERILSQSLTLVSNSYRTVDLTKLVSQSLTLYVESLRNWSLIRTASQTMSFAFNALADLTQVVSRFVSLTLGFASNARREITAIRDLSQTISTTLNANRVWSLTRTFTQPITAVFSAERAMSMIRSVSQSITTNFNAFRIFSPIRAAAQTITVNMNAERLGSFARGAAHSFTMVFDLFTKYVEGFEPPDPKDFVRKVSITFQLGLETLRTWNLTRVAEKAISFQSGAVAMLGEVKLRVVNLTLTLSADLGVWFTTINKSNIELAVLFAGTIFWTLLFMRKNFESIPNGLLTWMFSWGTGYYWLASGATLPAVAWLFIIWGIVALYKTILSFLEYRKFLASR